MAKPPLEGSQVLKNGTLISQPLRTNLGAHQQQKNCSLETQSCFQLATVLAKKSGMICYTFLPPELNY